MEGAFRLPGAMNFIKFPSSQNFLSQCVICESRIDYTSNNGSSGRQNRTADLGLMSPAVDYFLLSHKPLTELFC